VVEARNVAEAEEAFTSGDVELVLLDIHIGADDGVELMRSLRKRGLPAAVVLFTGSAQLDRDTRAEADGVVPKPFQLDELLGVVRTLIGRAPAG
jgi:DNA-binding response OmpR family regulator